MFSWRFRFQFIINNWQIWKGMKMKKWTKTTLLDNFQNISSSTKVKSRFIWINHLLIVWCILIVKCILTENDYLYTTFVTLIPLDFDILIISTSDLLFVLFHFFCLFLGGDSPVEESVITWWGGGARRGGGTLSDLAWSPGSHCRS